MGSQEPAKQNPYISWQRRQELLLFEFSPKSFVPVVVACVMGACMDIALKLTPACARMVPLKTDLLNERVKAVAFSG